MTVRNIERGLWLALFCWAFWFVVALFAASAARAQPIIDRPGSLGPVVVQLDGIPSGTLVTMLLRDIMRVPYVIAPDVLADKRPTSVRLIIPRNDIPGHVVGYLRKSGYSVELVGGSVYVSKPGGRYASSFGQSAYSSSSSIPSGSPLEPGRVLEPLPYRVANDDVRAANPTLADPQLSPAAAEEIVAYVPAHRDPSYLSSVITSVVPGITFGARADVRADAAQGRIAPENGPDVLVMAGSSDELKRARQLVQLLDRPKAMVSIKAVVVQADNVNSRGSAFSFLAKLGGGNLTAGINPADPPAANLVRIGANATSAVLSAVREDTRFKVVATPNLAALSGGVASINAGASVPTVGSVSIAEGGTPVQSIVYRDSGITLTVRPIVRGQLVELEVKQERSTFSRTSTGVADSPTLQKSTAEASVTLKSGESVVLAGLTEASAGTTRQGFLGGLLGVRGQSQNDSELLVILTAELVPQPEAAPGQFFNIETEETNDALAPA